MTRGPLRAWYAHAASARWPVTVFVVSWFVLVILPLLLLLVYTFLQSKGFRVVWEPTFATWATLFESGRWLVTVRTLRIAFTITADRALDRVSIRPLARQGLPLAGAQGGGPGGADDPLLSRPLLQDHRLA